ncbi:MAG: InlB B-repeat-containing protein [Clostridia bacterium]|nr:InlB B-repeat-containing protein [Clostridia bacterium]
MKKISVCILLITLLTGIYFSSYAETNMNYHISNVTALQGEEYGRNIKAAVYGFEETDNLSLRVGELRNPDNTLIDKISEYKRQNDKFLFVELTAFDTEQNSKIPISDKVDMQITLSKSGLGSGFAGCMGKDYKVLKVADTVEGLSVVESSLYDVTFESDELGIFAVIYNPYAISLSFMLDNENQHSQTDNLCISSVVNLPEIPQKDGYRFVGWYQRENGEGIRLYQGITLGEIASGVVYAYWIEDNTKYSASSTKLKSITFDNNITCELKENQYIYFLPEAKEMTEITATVEPENPYSNIYFGYSLDNIGELNPYPQNKDDMSYRITNYENANESRLYVKVVSEDTSTAAIYSFIFTDETPVIKIKPIEDSEHSWTLQANISGADSFILSDIYNSSELKIGEITNPDNSLQELVNDLLLDNDTVRFFDILAYDGNVVIDETATANIKVNLYRPLPAQMGERYAIYRIENNKLIPQNILSSSLDNVIFEADKTGRFALIYGDKVFSVQFVSDGDDYKTYNNLKVGDTISTPEKPTKSGYTFMGWYSNENGTGTKFDENTIISGNAIYYAYWKKNSSGGGGGITRYTVTFDTNGGSSISKQTVNRNATVKEPEQPQKEEYNFVGWFTDNELTKQFDFTTKITKSITLYAKWDIVDKTKD